MKHGMTTEYLKYRADLNFEVDFGINGVLGKLRPSGILFYLDNGSFSSITRIKPLSCFSCDALSKLMLSYNNILL